jgi:hypothetical protein
MSAALAMQLALTPAELRAAIYCRITAATEICNTYQRSRSFGQIQGLLFALLGEVYQVHLGLSVEEILTAAGIPFTKRDDGILETPDTWMCEHGFSQKEDGSYGNDHPRFSRSW